MDHAAWAVKEAAREVDVLHLHDVVGVPFTRLVETPVVLTLHHPHEPTLSEVYVENPRIMYVAISRSQQRREPMQRVAVVHHGLNLADYTFGAEKEDYLAFLGRMAPCKGAHLACEAAIRSGIPLRLAGEVQPTFAEYWKTRVTPYLGRNGIEFVGEADHAAKNELLSRARALLFPIEWDEPFGLVMIEAMACGTPVLAFDRGSVPEVIGNGQSGWLCRDVDEMADRARSPGIPAESCRAWVASRFSIDRMVDEYVAIYGRAISEGRLESPRQGRANRAASGGNESRASDIDDCVPA
jgi:glycosyltransferase involved in cell wall biosynthesis